ncbi:enoyl-CoA hydratase/isomerase family protein [Sedimentitalea todarodis]|uniref:3-hydroxyisobutyryl-CoA hydrolase n=1 Tax=Sedimentitalea todarodis TaxID=1631240 RepID=A0ABU3VD45_9RHOB|nr:enoyl-CoA hydratase/isomerase family protein [Sedimentitalea todarodis]MDU9003659.1 enoyl-CoA hydratase/isomerase family protein [Sedimentitalea todarodis]
MSDINIRLEGRAGRITLTRPHALNALSHDMCKAIDTALHLWREDAQAALIIIDAEGDKAFCAGGDIAELYETGMRGEFDYGRTFWRDEYRLNALLAGYSKPVVSFMQGFTMGGGVGIGCHGRHRVVEESSRIAMPECGIGLVPDVGGSYLLAHAPGHLGVYLGTTAARMDAGDAIFAGFADHFIPRAQWDDLIQILEASGDVGHLVSHAQTPPEASLKSRLPEIDRLFDAPALSGILDRLAADDSPFARDTLAIMQRNSPLAMACAIEIIRSLQAETPDMYRALRMEYRYTHRAMQQGDFLEGIRAAIIDKDRNPQWKFADQPVPQEAIDRMLAPLGAEGLKFET